MKHVKNGGGERAYKKAKKTIHPGTPKSSFVVVSFWLFASAVNSKNRKMRTRRTMHS